MSLAVVFPGQGSQEEGMRARVEAARPDLLAPLEEAVGGDPFARVEEGTRWAQPAIFAASLAAWAERDGGADAPEWVAGHSLGEVTALTVAGAMAERDAIELVALRGRLMGAAREGGMVALLGAGASEAAPELAAAHGLAVANDNAPGQVVLSGGVEDLVTVAEAAREHGLRPMELPVAGAFHSPLMAAAVAPFRAALDAVEVREPRIGVVSGVTAEPVGDVRALLADGIVRPVRWREVVLALRERGADAFEECGPGRVLTALIKRILPREVARG
jgi:malonyl CoA-acyl carrier protein transacylase